MRVVGSSRKHKFEVPRVFGVGLMLAGALALGLSLVGMSAAGATKPNPEHKVTLCHRTASYSNPYVKITVDVASVLNRHGHDGHNGPVFYSTIPKHTKWGDIIPSFDYGPGEQYSGKNLTTDGLAILDNGCKLPSSPTTTSASTSTTMKCDCSGTTWAQETTTTAKHCGCSTTSTSTTSTSTTSTSTTSTSTSTTLANLSVLGATTTLGTTSTTAGSTTSTTHHTTTSGVEPGVTAQGGPTPQGGTVGPAGPQIEVSPATAELPFTGSNAVPLAGLGLVLLGTGFGLTRVRSKRRLAN